MAETSIQISPAGTSTGAAPVVTPLKMILPADGSGTEVQCVTIVDDQGRTFLPMSEATGQQIVKLLTQLVTNMAVSTGGFLPSDDAAGLANNQG